MGAKSTTIKITVEAGGERFTIYGLRLLNNRYKIKHGRSWSKKVGPMSLSEIFNTCREWAVKKEREREKNGMGKL